MLFCFVGFLGIFWLFILFSYTRINISCDPSKWFNKILVSGSILLVKRCHFLFWKRPKTYFLCWLAQKYLILSPYNQYSSTRDQNLARRVTKWYQFPCMFMQNFTLSLVRNLRIIRVTWTERKMFFRTLKMQLPRSTPSFTHRLSSFLSLPLSVLMVKKTEVVPLS